MTVSETPSEAVGAGGARAGDMIKGPDGKRLGLFGRIALFVRQVVAELKKVVTPTRSELMTYVAVVIVFVLVVMAFVTALDFGFGKIVLLVFGK